MRYRTALALFLLPALAHAESFGGTSLQGPASSGAVAAAGATTPRTTALREGERPTVKDFGAAGNGTTDDTTAFQASVSADAANKLTTVRVGSYILSGGITVPAGGTMVFEAGSAVSGGSISAIADGSALVGNSGWLVGRAMGQSANEFAIVAQGVVPVTLSPNGYEKAAIYSRMSCSDPSNYSLNYLRDCVGVESQAVINSGNLLGRAWAYDSITTVPAGADGYASGMELSVLNSGSDQPLTATNTTKNGVHLVGGGSYGGTAAELIEGLWHDGVVCGGTISGDCVRVYYLGNTVASIGASGAANFTSISLGVGGVSTAGTMNWCLLTTATGYLSGCLYGANNSVTGQYSAAMGGYASDFSQYGTLAIASSNFGHGAGDSQMETMVLSGQITSTAPVRLTTHLGVAGVQGYIALNANRTTSVDCKLIAHSTTGQDSANWSLDDALFDVGASASTARLIGGSWTPKQASSGASGKLTPTVTADTTSGSVNLSASATSGSWDVVARCFVTTGN